MCGGAHLRTEWSGGITPAALCWKHARQAFVTMQRCSVSLVIMSSASLTARASWRIKNLGRTFYSQTSPCASGTITTGRMAQTQEESKLHEVELQDLEASCPATAEGPVDAKKSGVVEEKRLGFLDKYLSLWILLACGTGMGLGQASAVLDAIRATSIGTTNVLVAIGLIFMIYPPLAKVRWSSIMGVFRDRHLLVLSLALNWVVGPVLMFLLSVVFFHAQFPSFMSGLSLVGCARCIAMVLVWNDLAFGDNEYCAAIVALNSLVTIALYPPYSLFFIVTLPSAFFAWQPQLSMVSLFNAIQSIGKGSRPASVNVSTGDIAESVGIYLGVPLAAAVVTWLCLTKAKGPEWYYERFTPRIGKITLFSLLFTVVILFASQSKSIVHKAGAVAYAVLPLATYFFTMFAGTFKLAHLAGATYTQAVTLAFTAASNNFELSLAVSVGTFGLQSDQALMSVVGALIEIPTMLALVKMAFWFRRNWSFAPEALKMTATDAS